MINIIMRNLCIFALFLPMLKNIKGWNFTWTFGKVMRSKSMKMVFVIRIIRHKLCMIYAFFLFFCSKIIFDQKLFSYCWDEFNYPGSIVFLSCFRCHCFQILSIFFPRWLVHRVHSSHLKCVIFPNFFNYGGELLAF